MRLITREGKKNLAVRQCAAALVQDFPSKDYVSEIRALWCFVLTGIRYLRDVCDVETLQYPEQTLAIGQGDCDDKCILLASLLESIGHDTRFVALSFLPGQYKHVIVETAIGGMWLPLDATEDRPFGWYPPEHPQRMIIHNWSW